MQRLSNFPWRYYSDACSAYAAAAAKALLIAQVGVDILSLAYPALYQQMTHFKDNFSRKLVSVAPDRSKP